MKNYDEILRFLVEQQPSHLPYASLRGERTARVLQFAWHHGSDFARSYCRPVWGPSAQLRDPGPSFRLGNKNFFKESCRDQIIIEMNQEG